MKKLLLSLLSVAIIATAANAQICIAPELGLNMANMTFKSNNPQNSGPSGSSMKAGLGIGAIVDIGFTDNLFLQPGLFYLMNGCNLSGGGSINVSTIQIPVNVEYKLGEVGSGRFFFGVGPYLGYNIGGNYKFNGMSSSLKIGSDAKSDNLTAMDLGFGINLGYQLANNFYARAHYQMGLSNLQPGGDANNSTKTSAVGITVGYYFCGKKTTKKGSDMKK
jgi:hypothetical protein